MRKFFGIVCMLLGLAMVVGAGYLLYENREESETAGEQSETVLTEMLDAMATDAPMTALPSVATAAPTDAEATIAPTEMLAPEIESIADEIAIDEALEPTATPIPEMPTMMIDGHEYIGYLEMPTIGITLPVMSDWSYKQLRIAPCRYWGSAYDDSMVILAHNYDRHFGRISSLNVGDPVQFVDADGNIFKYVVAAHETLERLQMRKMVDNDYDLTLFTCTYGGGKRVTVRLERVLTY